MRQGRDKLGYAAALSALGVVYGDIGTSPLYALKESFHHTHGLAVVAPNILGILSLIFWSLIFIVTVKYLAFVLKADNQGEGGILALTALLLPIAQRKPKTVRILTLLGIFGTALLYGDGMITPAISVLSAVEGLELVTHKLHPYIVPITIAILIGLFSIQRHGTEIVGKVFGPVTLVWFIVIGGMGLQMIVKYPEVLNGLNPYYAFRFFVLNGWKSFVVMGSVFLVVTGGEALYSDLGHFGKTPIRQAWFVVVLPALVLNYFGQGALLLHEPSAIKSPLFLLAPNWALIPLVMLATASTVIASQALITGVFSLTMQAVQLQYVPRMTISHTSEHEQGQVFVKTVNFVLMIACILLVLMFRTSSNLAAAYGIAVTTTMVITTLLFYYFVVHSWNWSPVWSGLLCGFFLLIELAFWGANLLKIVAGGWFPILVGIFLFTIFTTWNRGRKILSERMISMIMPLEKFLEKVWDSHAYRVPGVAVYMTSHTKYAPATVIQNFHHFQSLHEHVVFLSVNTLDIPHVPKANRIKLQTIGPQIYRLTVTFGFMDIQNVSEQLVNIQLDHHTSLTTENATFFLGREHLIAVRGNGGMANWRERLFALMSRNAQTAAAFYHLPKERVVEVGSIVEL